MNTENGKFRFKKHENGKITTRNKEELLYTKAFIFDNYLVFKNKKKQGEGGGQYQPSSAPFMVFCSDTICACLAAATFLDSTTSGITASINDRDSITLSEPS